MSHFEPTHDWRLEARGLSVRRGARRVLHDVSLAIAAGERVSFIGPNGSGKTTLMLSLLGLLKPAAGGVWLDGRAFHRLAAAVRGRFAAYVPQFVDRLPAFRVIDVVATGRFPHVSPLRPLSLDDRRIVADVLEQCGLTALAERPIHSISGGERQKALLAAALAQDARALFLDEPTTALDPAYQVELVRLLRAWHARGRAVVLVSHDLQLPAALGGRVVALREGRAVADGLAEALLRPEQLAPIYGTKFERAETTGGRVLCVPHWD
ncbi:MAG: ABC transporter ATP-binding protein [Phycisphaerae bacterium]